MEEQTKECVEFKVDRKWYEEICRRTREDRARVRRQEAERVRQALIEKIMFNSSIGKNSFLFCDFTYEDILKEVLEEFKDAGFRAEPDFNHFYYDISWDPQACFFDIQ